MRHIRTRSRSTCSHRLQARASSDFRSTRLNMEMNYKVCQGLKDIFSGAAEHGLGGKKAVLLDQFGVLHDGKTAYPGAIEALAFLHKICGLRILVLSNSSRRSAGALDSLKRKGFDTDLIEGVITSGEVTFQKLTGKGSDFWEARKKCVHFTWSDRGAIPLDGLDIEVVGRDVSRADSILAHGTEAIGTRIDGTAAESCTLDDMKRILDFATGRNEEIPMIVANPDLVTVNGSDLIVMPGTLAKYYESKGGRVERMGKPSSVIYEEALQMLSLGTDDVIAIGDSLEHDIFGAKSMGIDSIFIAGGIHKDQALDVDNEINRKGSEDLFIEYGCVPNYILAYFGI